MRISSRQETATVLKFAARAEKAGMKWEQAVRWKQLEEEDAAKEREEDRARQKETQALHEKIDEFYRDKPANFIASAADVAAHLGVSRDDLNYRSLVGTVRYRQRVVIAAQLLLAAQNPAAE